MWKAFLTLKKISVSSGLTLNELHQDPDRLCSEIGCAHSPWQKEGCSDEVLTPPTPQAPLPEECFLQMHFYLLVLIDRVRNVYSILCP